ncbi:nucleoside-diphosphate sugar epimerase/dehydratase [Candidatus Villigracilis saccharophilus]|uniref:polysaccharide biosynthesis protein n=1 Tax=Candidatus Villigracilis saccharophilus TaxID=3140684 RepID=UPI0031375205|nr:polysaccharide biosynthesis protein [Anaerolineales bacterium]
MPSSRPKIRNRFVLIGDIALIIISVLGSFALRLDVSELPFYFPAALVMCAVGLIIKLPVYFYFGLYRRLWIYASTSELRLITVAVTAASVLTSGVMLLLISLDLIQPGMPRSALGIDWLLSLVLIGGSRFALRILAEQSAAPRNALRESKRILIIGAGDAGALVARELQKSSQLNLVPIGFLDDDPAKQNHQIYGISVIGKINKIAGVLDSKQIDEVIIAIPSAPGKIIRLVNDACRQKGISSRTIPGIYELIGGKVSVNRLREVDITDLLRRDPIKIDDQLIGAIIKGRRVLVTGAGGSIGREICRQVARWEPSELILLGHGENSIFESLLELTENFSTLPIRPVIADVRDAERIQEMFKVHRPQVVFHAAAHKHVPLMEANVEEAVTNNVLGTRNVVAAADRHKVERLVLISTDKAVRPVSIMGATKRLAEMIVLDAAHRNKRAYSVVRFGNVLGSRGSVVPLFKNQIARGGPVTVTHPDMHRYFMTIPEAVHLVLQAAAMGAGGEVFMLNMGQQVRILDLAEDLIRLSGLEPHRDIEITFSGIRPGEKLREDLWEDGVQFEPTHHSEIYRAADEEKVDGTQLAPVIDELIELAHHSKTDQLIRLLDESIPSASVRITAIPDMTSLI